MASKQTVLITGCSDDGIGFGLALIFQQRGFLVFATARNQEKMSKLKDLPNVILLTLDVRDKSHIEAAAETVRQHTGGSLDYLINNAGRNYFMPVLDQDIDAARNLFEHNVWGPLAVTQTFAPLVIKAKGSIVFVTSISGYLNVPYMSIYCSSKRSIELIAETLRLELAPFQVKVLSVVTGAVKTRGQTYFDDFKLPSDSLYKPIEETIAARARGEDGRPRGELMEHCQKVVADITAGKSGKVWQGKNAGSTKFGTHWLPTSMMDRGVASDTGLDILASRG